MKPYKFQIKHPISLRSMFFSKKEWTFFRNQKQVFRFMLKNIKMYIEYFFFKCHFFFLSIKKNYLSQLLSLNDIRKLFLNKVLNEKIKNSRNTIMFFFNVPFICSKILFEIVESIKKKTIYLYRILLLLSMPIILYCVNKTFIIQEKKDFLSFIIPEKKNFFFHEKNSLFFQDLKKEILRNQIFPFLSNKKNFEKSQSSNTLRFAPLFSLTLSSYSFINRQHERYTGLKEIVPCKQEVHFFSYSSKYKTYWPMGKWLYIYLNIKKKYSSNFQNDWNNLNEKSNSLQILKLFQLSKKTFLKFHNSCYNSNINSYFKKIIFKKIDNFLFSLMKPRDFNYFNKVNLKVLSNKRSFVLNFLESSLSPIGFQIDRFFKEKGRFNSIRVRYEKQNQFLNTKSIFIGISTQYSKQKKINKNLLQSINKQYLIIPINQWIELYNPQNNLKSFSKKKETLKENIQLFNNFNFIITIYKNFLQNICVKPLLNSTNLPFSFLKNKQQFLFKSYKNSLNFNNLNKFTESSFLKFCIEQKDYEYIIEQPNFFKIIKNNKNILKKINFLYNFHHFVLNKNFFFNPEVLFLVQNKIKVNNYTLVKNQKLYDFDFYLKNYKPKDDFFWISNLSLQKNILEQKDSKFFTSFQDDLNLIQKRREKFNNIIISNQSNLLKKYHKWFFTPQWWFFRQSRLINDSQNFFKELNNHKQIFIQSILNICNEINKKFFLYKPLNIVPHNFLYRIQGWNKFFIEKIDTTTQEKNLWINLKLFTSINNSSWNFFSWFLTSSLIYYHWLPMLTGIIYLYFWLDFEKIRSLSYPSWKTFISILVHNSFDSPSHQLRLVSYSSQGKILTIYSVIYTKFIENFSFFNRLHYTTTLDLSKKKKNLVSNSLITKKTLQSKYNFWNINKQNENRSINGFNFFQKWCQKNYRISGFIQKNGLKSYSFNWLTDLFFYNKFVIFSYNKNSKPNSFLEPVAYTKRWLFIGSAESGKSFAIKNIATSTHYPLIHISIKYIKNVTPDNKYNKLKKQKRWIEQLSERSFFLENIFNLAKMLAPSMLWISDLHEFYTKDQIQEKNANKFDASFLMATLLKILTIDLVPECQNHITFVGSTDHPRLLDPKFISRHRLDLIVNFRDPSINQRQSIFTLFLKKKGFTIKGLRSFYELSCNTIGYSFQDITSLINETLLIKTSENTTLIDSNTIRLALYRKTSIQSVKYMIGREENLQYKIGKALIQTILLYPKSILLLSKYHDLWKTKFYYLSNSYLEISNKKTITTEISMLIQVLNCLAGSAARDAWLLTPIHQLYPKKDLPTGTLWTKKIEERGNLEKLTLALTSQLKHDFCIASNIMQSLLTEFPMHEINTINKKKNLFKKVKFQFIKKLIPYLEFFDQFPSYIDWSIKTKRLSFSWLLLFSEIKHSTKNIISLINKNIAQGTSSSILEKEIDINIPYERRETKQQQQKIQKIESLFTKTLYTVYMQNLGFPWDSEYIMDYNPLQFSLFFIETRPLWNSQTLLPAYSILFFDRDLLINQKLLTNLYITYGNKFQNEKLNRKRIKKQFFWSNSTFNKLNLNKKLETKNDFVDYRIQDFYFYQNLINLNAQLDQSQIQLPVYLHQGWITPDHNETFRTFDFLYTRLLENNNNLIYKESLLFENLLEIYHYLLKFFIKNNYMMTQLKKILIKNNILYRQDIEIFMKKMFKS